MVNFYEMDFMKVNVILVKADEMYNMLAIVYFTRDEDRIGLSKFFVEFAFECPYVYYAPPLLRGSLHLVRDTAAEKESDIAIEMTLLEHVSSEIQENRNERKN